MRKTTSVVVSVTLSAALFGAGAATARVTAAPPPGAEQCGASSAPEVRTTLYFGSSRTKGSVSELEWQLFLCDEVTSRFPDGLTVWDADGQWRAPSGAIDHERSKVLLLVYPDSTAARANVQPVIAKYRQAFDQQSVLWETAKVCAAS